MKRLYKSLRIVLVIVVGLALISMAFYGGRLAWTRSAPLLLPLTVTIQPRDFAPQITAVGELQSAESLAIAVPNVPVRWLRVASVIPDGRHVSKGDTLVEFDPADLDLQMLEQRSDLEIANRKISKGELATNVEKTDILKEKKIAEIELQKLIEFLPKDQIIYSQREIIEAQLDKTYTEKKIVFAGARLQLKGKVYTLDEAILLLERQRATAQIQRVEQGLASLKLVSPASGIVAHKESGYFFGGQALLPGAVARIGMTLFNLINPDKMEALCFVLEKDAGELRTDQSVTLTLDPFPGAEFTGKVKSIDKLARPIEQGSPVKYFQTIIALDRVDPRVMKPGIKLRAQIHPGELKSVIVVPRSALVKKDSGFVVHIQKGPNRFEPVPVSLGQGDLIQVVVTKGLQPGQILALNPPDIKKDFSPGANKKS